MSTKIQWTQETWNIITGCSQYSEGCKNCYAKSFHRRLTGMKSKKYDNPFNKVIFHDEEIQRKLKNNSLVFVNSMSDTFHENIQDVFINRILSACEARKTNRFQILTKRAYRLPDFKYPDNVWLGVTVENEKHKDRIKYLKNTNAKIKFLSCEPLLSDLGEIDLNGIDWVIAGGETGPSARPMHPQWIENIMNQCKKMHVPFFFKQWGSWIPETMIKETGLESYSGEGLLLNFDGSISSWEDVKENQYVMFKVGSKIAGSKIHGQEFKEYPI